MRKCFLPSLLQADVCYGRDQVSRVSPVSRPAGSPLQQPLLPVRIQCVFPLCQLLVLGLLTLIGSLTVSFVCAHSSTFLTRGRSVVNPEETPDPVQPVEPGGICTWNGLANRYLPGPFSPAKSDPEQYRQIEASTCNPSTWQKTKLKLGLVQVTGGPGVTCLSLFLFSPTVLKSLALFLFS